MKSFDKLKEVVSRLRAEDGCPWDKEQTHSSLKASVIEEAAEQIPCFGGRGGRTRLGSSDHPA